MATSFLMVFSEAAAGRESEYNDWYSNTHLAEILALPGFVSAQRFRAGPQQLPGHHPATYVALYEVEGDPAVALKALHDAFPDMQMTDAIDMENTSSLMVAAITERLYS